MSFEIVSYFDIRISNFEFGCGQRPRQDLCVSVARMLLKGPKYEESKIEANNFICGHCLHDVLLQII